MIVGNATQSGQLLFPAGEGEVSFALRTDMAEGLANALISAGHENKVYEIGAPTAWSFHDIAAALSQSGKAVAHVDIPTHAYATELQKHLPPQLVSVYMGMAEGLQQNAFNQPDPMLEHILQRQPVSLEAYLNNAL